MPPWAHGVKMPWSQKVVEGSQVSESEKNKSLSFRMTEAEWEELAIISKKRRQSIQQMLEDGLGLLLGRSSEAEVKVEPGDDVWIQMARFILAQHGTTEAEEAHRAVKSNLTLFYHHVGGKDEDLVRQRAPKRKTG